MTKMSQEAQRAADEIARCCDISYASKISDADERYSFGGAIYPPSNLTCPLLLLTVPRHVSNVMAFDRGGGMLPDLLWTTCNAKEVYTVGLAGKTRVPCSVSILLRLSCLLLIAGRAATADTVALTNGDKLTCDIKELEDGKLTVTVGYADDTELTFDWKMVSSITSETALKV